MKTQRKIKKIYERVRREYKREPRHGDIVAQMTFGFWCSFFHRKYDPILWHCKDSFRTVFPNLARANRKRSYIEQRLLKIKEVRNRIAHHEPVWSRRVQLALVHKQCLELIEAISKSGLCMLQAIDRFPEVSQYLLSPTLYINNAEE